MIPKNHRRVLVLLALCVSSCQSRTPQPRDTAKPYAVDAAGRPATVEHSVTLTWLGNDGAGLILNAEVCGGEVYLLAPALKFVQVADLASGVAHRRIGKPGNGPEDLRRPVSIGVDCARGKLYVVEGQGGVLAFSLANGQYEDSYAHAAQFRSSMGARTLVSANGQHLILAGLWSPRPGTEWVVSGRMFADHQMGLQLPLEGAGGTAIAPTYERGCDTDLTSCLRVDLQPLDGGDGWVAAQGGSTHVTVLSSSGAVVRSIDIRSPEFVRDGSTPGRETEAQLKWGVTNSTIWGLFAMSDRIAVVHARNATKDWHRGQVMQFDVFMNLYSSEGEPLVSDIRLPGLPVGRDHEHVLVIDYGPLGRRSDASQVALVKIPIRKGTQPFQAR